jgi:hypothetical protein
MFLAGFEPTIPMFERSKTRFNVSQIAFCPTQVYKEGNALNNDQGGKLKCHQRDLATDICTSRKIISLTPHLWQ